MTPSEIHYLNCTNEDCELFACVARRDYERKIGQLHVRNQRLEEALKECRECDHPDDLINIVDTALVDERLYDRRK